MMYLLDTNVFIQAKNLHDGFDFCPGFWTWIDRANTAGKVFSISKVFDELRALSRWANDGRYEQTGVATFLKAADDLLRTERVRLVLEERPAA